MFEDSNNYYGKAGKFVESAKRKNAEGDLQGALEDLNRALELEPENIELYCFRGDLKIKMGDRSAGFKDFEKAMEIEPDSPKVHFARAMAYTLGNDGKFWSEGADFDAAIGDYSRLIELLPDNPLPYYYRGMCRISSPNYPDTYAIDDFNKVLDINPNFVDALTNRGIAKYNLGNYPGAYADLHQAIEIEPRYDVAYFWRAKVKAHIKKFKRQDRLNDISKAIELAPNKAQYYQLRALIYSTNELKHIYQVGCDLDKSIADYDRAIELRPDDPFLWMKRGRAKEHAGYYVMDYLPDFDEAVRLDSENIDALKERAGGRMMLADFKGAKKDYERVLEINPEEKFVAGDIQMADYFAEKWGQSDILRNMHESRIYEDAGRRRLKHGDYEGSIEACTEALKHNPKSHDALHDRATCYQEDPIAIATDRIGTMKKAIADYDRLIELSPKNAEYYLERGSVRMMSGDSVGGREDFDKAAELNPEEPTNYSIRAMQKMVAKDYSGAKEDLDKAIELDPKGSRGMYYFIRADAHNLLGNSKEAVEDCTAAIENGHRDAAIYVKRGMFRTHYHDYKGAITDAEKALEIDKRFTLAYNVMSKAYHHLVQPKKAYQAAKKALEIDPDCDWAKKAISYWDK